MGTTPRYLQHIILILFYFASSSCYADVVIPNVLGLSLNDAKETLQANGLTLGSIQNQRTNRPTGTVIVQAPQANKQVKKGHPIRLVIAIPLVKPKTTKVPNLKGMSFSQAKAAIGKANLTLGNIKKRKIKIDNEEVLYQSPKAGKGIVIKSKINLTLSDPIKTNDPRVKVIIDKTRFKAGESILITAHVSNVDNSKSSEYGFSINGRTHYSKSPSYRYTFPKAGRYILTASFRYTRGKWYASLSKTVRVTAAKKAKSSNSKKAETNSNIPNIPDKDNKAKTPNVIGLSLASAKRVIKKAGLSIGNITERKDNSGKKRILKQSPRADKRVKKGSKVNLIISTPLPTPWQKPSAIISPPIIKVIQGEKARFYNKSTHDKTAKLSSSWTSKMGEKITGNKFKLETQQLKVGQYWVKLSIKDNKGYSDTASAKLIIIPKQLKAEKNSPKSKDEKNPQASDKPESKVASTATNDKQITEKPNTLAKSSGTKKKFSHYQQETTDSNYIEALTIEANNTTGNEESALSSGIPIQQVTDLNTLTKRKVNSQESVPNSENIELSNTAHIKAKYNNKASTNSTKSVTTNEPDFYWYVWVWLLLVLFIIGTLLLILWRYHRRHHAEAATIDFKLEGDMGKQEILTESQSSLNTIHFNSQTDKGEQHLSPEISKTDERRKSDQENETN